MSRRGWGDALVQDLVARGRLPSAALSGRPAAKASTPVAELPKLRRGRAPNKTETRWLQRLAADPSVLSATYEGVTLRLADGVRYTPDVFVVYRDGSLGLDEVKGAYVRPDALVKLRIAVSQYPAFRWRLAMWRRGEWLVRIEAAEDAR